MLAALLLAQVPTIKSMDWPNQASLLTTALTIGLTGAGYAIYAKCKNMRKASLLYYYISINDIQHLTSMLGNKSLLEERWDGDTPLQYAVNNGRDQVLAALLSAGANPNVRDNSRDGIAATALNNAAKLLNNDAVALLRACGALPLLTDDGGRNAFDIASTTNPPGNPPHPEEEMQVRRDEIVALLNSREKSTEHVLKLLREDEDFVVLPKKIKDNLEARILGKHMDKAVQQYLEQNKQEPLRAQLNKNRWAFRHFISPCLVANKDDFGVEPRPALPKEVINNIFSYLDRDQLSDKELASLLNGVKQKAVRFKHREMLKLATTVQENLQHTSE